MSSLAALVIAASATLGHAEQLTAEDYVKFFSFQVGEWEWVRSDGEEGTCTFTMSPTENCLLAYVTMNGEPYIQAIAAYDPEQKGWKRILIGAKGWQATILVKTDKATLAGSRAGVTFKNSSKTILPDGSVRDSTEVLTVVDDDTWKSQADDTVVTFKRIEN